MISLALVGIALLQVAGCFFESYSLTGHWTCLPGQPPGFSGFMQHCSGASSANLYSNSSTSSIGLELALFDSQYVDGRQALLYFELPLLQLEDGSFDLDYTEEVTLLLSANGAA